MANFSVIIPAHNEEAVISRCLAMVFDGAPDDELPEVIVVANGCTDRTAEVARSVAPSALVLEIPVGSKPAALNAGNEVAVHTPRLFLDADIQCNYASLAATAEALREPGVDAASPSMRVDVSRCDYWVRAFYRVWVTQPYVTDRMVGSGLYGLSANGLAAIGRFPAIFGDDIWVKTRFPYDQRRSVLTDKMGQLAFFTVSPPRTVADLIRIEARRRSGDHEVRKGHPNDETGTRTSFGTLSSALQRGASLLDLLIYVSIKVIAQVQFRVTLCRGRSQQWTRDMRARDL